MINQDVLSYIKNELARGASRDEIKKNLISGGGWTGADVDFHFGVLGEPALPKIVPRPAPVNTTTASKPAESANPIMVRTQATDQANLENLTSLMTHSLNTGVNLVPATPKTAVNHLPPGLATFEPAAPPTLAQTIETTPIPK
ncbi:MAG: hypothetical protein AAB965_03745 [Patescibacteria group bacterium]